MAVNAFSKARRRKPWLTGDPFVTSWPSGRPPPGFTTGTHAGTPRCLPCQLAGTAPPPLAALCLSGWPEQAPRPAPPLLTSADFSSPLPGLPEQAACVWGWEGLGGGGTVTPLILASQRGRLQGRQWDGAWDGRVGC